MGSGLISALMIAFIQGVSEWLPISSSGHLILAEKFLEYSGGLMFDVALHFGTLMAVFVYFGKDIMDIIEDLIRLNVKSSNFKMGIYLMTATIPAAVVGYLFVDIFESVFNSLVLTGLGFGVTGLVLFIGSFSYGSRSLNLKNSFLIGLSQVLSLFPGVSRSGTTIASGIFLGLNEKEAVKFSFLMSIPVIFGANILTIGNNSLPKEMIWATIVSFLAGLVTIHYLFRYVLVERKRFRWFGAYCLVLSFVILSYLIFI